MYSISKKSLEKMLLDEANRELKHRQAIDASRTLYKEAALNRKKHYKAMQLNKTKIEECETTLNIQASRLKELEKNIQKIKGNRNVLQTFKNKHSKFIKEMKKINQEPRTSRVRRKPNRYSPSPG